MSATRGRRDHRARGGGALSARPLSRCAFLTPRTAGERHIGIYATERIAKGKAVARSKLSYQFEVKPLEAGQDMEGLAQNIKKLSHDGIVTWGEQHKIVDVAFGIQKVLVQVIIYEDACCEDDLVDLITENFEDEVQSVDLIAMTKL